jgi:ATP-binding cassette subfamily C (CFTR/MRP) protein 2
MTHWQVMTGVRSSNALVTFVYNKHLDISGATNKEFNSGEIVNFVQVDAEMLFWLCYQMSDIARIPFIFGLCFTLFFKYVGYSFFAGLGIFAMAFFVNTCTGTCYNTI